MVDVAKEQWNDSLKEGRSSDDIRNIYNKWATNYDQHLSDLNFNGPRIGFEYLKKYVPNKEAYILDCACGTGLLGKYSKSAGYENLHGVDFSEASITVAESRNSYSKLIMASITDGTPELKTGSYDVVISIGCFCPSHFKADLVNEMVRIVKPDGFLIILMNKRWLTEGEYKDGALEAVYENLISLGKCVRVEQTDLVNYIKSDLGVAEVFRIQ